MSGAGDREGELVHGAVATNYRQGCRCVSCRRTESLRVRAAYESACVECGAPCWGHYAPGRRCKECVRRDRKRRSVQPRGLTYQWGCP